MRFWLGVLLLSPLLLWQARRTRATTPRLPEAQGDAFGEIAAALALLCTTVYIR